VGQTYHIEAVGFEEGGRAPEVVQRLAVRSDALEAVHQRAMRLFQRARAPQWTGAPIEAVRILDGAGTEVFRWSVWDDMSAPRSGRP
jgi:hypothetical protein